MASSLFYISCSSEYVSSQTGCSDILTSAINSGEVVANFEKMLDYAQSVDYQESYTTYADFHKTLYGESEQATAYVNAFESESTKYATLGFESYVNDNNHISNNLKNYLIDYSQNLLTFLNTNHPNLSTFTQYITDQMAVVKTSELCSTDKDLMSLYLSASQGYANWYYKHYSDSNTLNNDENIKLRGCNGFWEVLGCGSLAVVVGAVVFIVVGAAVLLASVTFTDPNGNSTPVTGNSKDGLAALAGFALGIYVGINIYKWCCGRDDVPEQVCLAPTGSTLMQTGCNTFTYRVFGPSNYGATEWGPLDCPNVNTSPLTVMTPTPRFSFSVPSFGLPSTICANVACLANGSSLEIFPWGPDMTVINSNSNFFPLLWKESPPSTFNFEDNSNTPEGDHGFDNIIFVSVNTPMNNVMTYSWTVNSPHTIVGGGGTNDNFATIKITNPNTDLFTAVSATNVCLNETESLFKETIIQ